ncbi:hypothetical protein CDL12_05286 [Handroanthus impetiginosus]|uniref:ENTH domain-containing protein n=1 Tax=Handroanthus impetiginosus TaxID=429701 RepID=A0A2G9HWW1_9LAMI|nr:hypothetical protein CDL12_05286 [Handroanthus impetiginosus]
MSTPTFHDFKKQASFFVKEKIKTARLALTDVTPAQLLAEEATNGNPGGPDAPTLKMLSKAAFEVDDYWRIVGILHKRLVKFDKRNWRTSYKALIVLEYLLTHGPESVAEDFQREKDVIREMEGFQHVDEKGFNWGLNVRRKSERILKLLEKGPLLKEERDKARKISRGIQGFGSYCLRSSSAQENLQESSPKPFGRCNSNFVDRTNHGKEFKNGITNSKMDNLKIENLSGQVHSKENLPIHESKALLEDKKDESRMNISTTDDHPFDDADNLTARSLLSTAE